MTRSVLAAITALAGFALVVTSCKGTLAPEDADAAGLDASGADAAVVDSGAVVADADAAPSSEDSGRAETGTDGGPIGEKDSGLDAGACGLPKVVGPCEAAIPRFWFNATTGRCERFIYGGCGANANNFQSIEDCSAACAPTANPCTITECGPGLRCVFQGTRPRCAAPCDDAGACNAPEACSCGASCAGCRDCVRVCF